jgi:hypothetical protein
MTLTKWLLDSDPAIRWQVMRDLTDEPDDAVTAERSRVAREGWGAQLLALQMPDGNWGGSEDRGWLATIYTLARPHSGAHHLAAARRPAVLRW